MRWIRVTRYLSLTAVRSMRASWGIQLLAMATVATAFMIEGGMWIGFRNLRSILIGGKGAQHVSVYFHDAGFERGSDSVLTHFCNRPFVRKCEKVTAETAKARFLEKNVQFSASVRALQRNPFPGSVEMVLDPDLKDRDQLKRFTGELRAMPEVEDLDDGGAWMARWISILQFVDWAFKFVGLALSLAMVFVIANTIKLIVYTRRDEVEILGLVGATPMMIRVPFLLEGFIQGAGGAGLAVLSLQVFFAFAEQGVVSKWGSVWSGQIHFLSAPDQLWLVLAGGFIGVIGSAVAVGRFLKI